MSVSKDEIKEALGKMPVMELVELISELEEDWGVSAAAPVAAGRQDAGAPRGAGAAEDQAGRRGRSRGRRGHPDSASPLSEP